jgi:hypothetical protein
VRAVDGISSLARARVGGVNLGPPRGLLKVASIYEAMPDRQLQLQFDFFGDGNWQTGHQFMKTIVRRLNDTGASASEQRNALAALTLICCYLGWQTYVCQLHAVDLAAELHLTKANMSRTLRLLETVGAITRVKRGQAKVITVTPEGAYYGDLKKHDTAVKRYTAEVLRIVIPAMATL